MLQTQNLLVSSKAVENWINSTLTDAEHLDIPSVILKPKNKVPLTRYGIDRIVLTSAGLSPDMVDRIYRSLFVYSVGFFELLKQQMINCSDENSLRLLMNLWKTYGILLEYACKTEYRLLISRIQSLNELEKQQLEEKYKILLSNEKDEKKTLKQNILVMNVF